MSDKGWWDYFVATAGTADGATIAAAAGVTAPQVSRWKSGTNRPDADKVVRFARHYGKQPLEALIAAGYISAAEAGASITIARPASDLPDEELLNEVYNRMRGARRGLESETEQNAPTQSRQAQEAELRRRNEPQDHGIPDAFLPPGYNAGVVGSPGDNRRHEGGSG